MEIAGLSGSLLDGNQHHYVSLIERKRGTLRNGESLRTETEPLKKLQAILLRHKGDRFMAQNEPAWQNPLTGHAAERPYSGRVERLQRVESTSSSLA